jgi:hypothetical protein
MSLFVFFISLLIVAQHVSGNHVPVIRSWRLCDVIALCWYVPWLREGGQVRLVGSASMDGFVSYPHWITMHGQPHIRFTELFGWNPVTRSAHTALANFVKKGAGKPPPPLLSLLAFVENTFPHVPWHRMPSYKAKTALVMSMSVRYVRENTICNLVCRLNNISE